MLKEVLLNFIRRWSRAEIHFEHFTKEKKNRENDHHKMSPFLYVFCHGKKLALLVQKTDSHRINTEHSCWHVMSYTPPELPFIFIYKVSILMTFIQYCVYGLCTQQ